MLSATDFFPSSMTLFMNFDSTVSPKRGSGRISRRSGRRRRAIGYSFTTASRREALWDDQIAEKAVLTSDASRRISNGSACGPSHPAYRSEEHTSELQSLMRISYAVFCLTKK